MSASTYSSTFAHARRLTLNFVDSLVVYMKCIVRSDLDCSDQDCTVSACFETELLGFKSGIGVYLTRKRQQKGHALRTIGQKFVQVKVIAPQPVHSISSALRGKEQPPKSATVPRG